MYFVWLFGFLALLMLGCMAKEDPVKMERELREFFFLTAESNEGREENQNDS